MKFTSDLFMHTEYFAPRGHERLMALGNEISQQHLRSSDKCIGILGQSGAGKSRLIRGMFPGLQLTNDDEAIYTRPLPILDHFENGDFKDYAYHLDARLEAAFTQPYVISEAINAALQIGRRVVVEHFDLLYPTLGRNADLLVGIGEEVIVTRPNLFGPVPADISARVFKSIKYRRMVHTAEDIIGDILEREYGVSGNKLTHGDVMRGFVLEFASDPHIDIAELDAKARKIIDSAVSVAYIDEMHIRIGEHTIRCTGPRIHLSNTSELEFFEMAPQIIFNPVNNSYMLVGVVAKNRLHDLRDINNFNNIFN